MAPETGDIRSYFMDIKFLLLHTNISISGHKVDNMMDTAPNRQPRPAIPSEPS
jgi:hypothetical protein